MFEITGKDIAELNDADLRTLVARLAIAELRANHHPISAVTAGGSQDAPDGGLDVRVSLPKSLDNADFVPRASTGFQVKASDMAAAAIKKEMRPSGKLRNSIATLATESGAYIIVSSKGSVADEPLNDRRKAMKAALGRHAGRSKIALDFYDRERIATWVNKYPGTVAWVRHRSGNTMSGWRHMGDWTDTKVGEETEFLTDDKACLIDERTKEYKRLTIAEGISQLRESLGKPGQCVRLVGLSGHGKTRLVQALFESSVGNDALDPSLALYTDYSEKPTPMAREMAHQLVEFGERAILVIDNCNPATHSALAKICSTKNSKVSLITVEHDVSGDEPERTQFFRLMSASRSLVSEWIRQTFPHVSQVDRERIADFSENNFRVARAIAETLQKGETLGQLKDNELLDRIFRQGKEPDKQLQQAAGELSLLYSFDGDDTSSTSELATLAGIRSTTASELYAHVAELRARGIIQARGRWRAILPQAIANRLASLALTRISPADFDAFCSTLSPRMLKSLSRRLGYLHDSDEAQSIVARWLQPGERLGDFASLDTENLKLLENVAPVAPEAILKRLKETVTGANGSATLAENFSHRSTWIKLVRALAYEPHLFQDAVEILALFSPEELESNNVNDASNQLRELFHLTLSGTQAPPAARRDAIRRFAASNDPHFLRIAEITLRSLFKSGHFSSSRNFDFGARPRDWGWRPGTEKDFSEWFEEGISLALELLDRIPKAKSIIAGCIRSLWPFPACRDAIENAASKLTVGGTWVEGWLAVRSTLKYDGEKLRLDKVTHQRLLQLAELLRPTDLLHRARAVILSHQGVYDFSDGESGDVDAKTSRERTEKLAQEIGKELALDPSIRRQFLNEVFASERVPRAYECGRGLAEGCEDLASMWSEILSIYKASNSETRNLTLAGGFLFQAHQRDPSFYSPVLDAIVADPLLSIHLPYLQARVAIDDDGILRLRTAIQKGVTPASAFRLISNGLIEAAPPRSLASLLKDLSTMQGGVEVAIDILHMRFFCERDSKADSSPHLIAIGRLLVERTDLSKMQGIGDHDLSEVIEKCLGGDEGKKTAAKVCRSIRKALEKSGIWLHDLRQSVEAILKLHPHIALDQLLLNSTKYGRRQMMSDDFGDLPLESLDSKTLRSWADKDPEVRYPLLAECLNLFETNRGDDTLGLSQHFLELLEFAPDKTSFLGDLWHRLHSNSSSGSISDLLIRRRELMKPLEIHADPTVREWVANSFPVLDKWIEEAKSRNRAREESFE